MLDPTFFDLIFTEESVTAVLKQMAERDQLQKKCVTLQKQLDGTNTVSSAAVPVTSFENEAEQALAKAEQFAEDLKKAQSHIADLEALRDQLQAELENRPNSVDAAKQALQEQLAALKGINIS